MPKLDDSAGETVCLGCNEINILAAGEDIKTRECDDCHHKGMLVLISDYNRMSYRERHEAERKALGFPTCALCGRDLKGASFINPVDGKEYHNGCRPHGDLTEGRQVNG